MNVSHSIKPPVMAANSNLREISDDQGSDEAQIPKPDTNPASTKEAFDEVPLIEDERSNDGPAELKVDTVDTISASCGQHLDQLLSAQLRPSSSISGSSHEETMFSTASTPLGTPKVGNSRDNLHLPCDQQALLEEMKQQNGIILDLRSLEEKYERKILDVQTERTSLEQTIVELNERLTTQQNDFDKTVIEVKNQMGAKLEAALKSGNSSRKDLESMVIKYATSERQVIAAKKAKEDAEKKANAALKDKESLNSRIRGLSNEKASLTNAFEKKVAENAGLLRDIERFKKEVIDRDSKWKQATMEFKLESDHHSETRAKLREITQQLEKALSENEELRGKIVETSEEDDTTGNKSTEPVEDEVEIYKKKWTDLAEENHSLSVKLQHLERNRLDHEHSISKLKETISTLQSEILDCNSRLSSMDQLKNTLEMEKDLKSNLEREVERLKVDNSDLLIEMDLCRQKEGELLEFTERVTSKNVKLQSEHNALEQRCAELTDQAEKNQLDNDKLTQDMKEFTNQLERANQELASVRQALADKENDKIKTTNELSSRIEELENEARIAKKKHLHAIKELTKELSSARRKFDNMETGSNLEAPSCHSMGSRTSSSTSLDHAVRNSSSNGNRESHSSKHSNNGSVAHISTPPPNVKGDKLPELDMQMLVDKIIRLQRTLGKRNQRIDFLEEHNHQLVEEMKKRAKLGQYYSP